MSKRKNRDEEFFGIEPVSVVHNFCRAANDYTSDHTDGLENFLQKEDLKTAEKKEIKKVTEKKLMSFSINMFGFYN